MLHEKLVLKVSQKKRRFFLLFCLAATVCFCQTTAAQSGRRTNKGGASSKPPAASQPTADSPAVKPDAKITSLIVLGKHRDTGYYFSTTNYLDVALKECVDILKNHARRSGSGLNVTKGGKTDFAQAVERAKKETDAHILWIELVTTDDGYANMVVDFIDYAVLAPETAKRLTTGRVEPRQNQAVVQGGVIRLPRVRRASLISEIIWGASLVTGRLIRWDWL